MNATKIYELAAQDEHGGWDLVAHFPDRYEALEAAKKVAFACHRDDSGMVVFGLSADPDSGHYEERIGLLFEDGQYVLIDPLP
jgi:hypothetical protein